MKLKNYTPKIYADEVTLKPVGTNGNQILIINSNKVKYNFSIEIWLQNWSEKKISHIKFTGPIEELSGYNSLMLFMTMNKCESIDFYDTEIKEFPRGCTIFSNGCDLNMLKEIILPKNLIKINSFTFCNLKNVKTLKLPKSLKIIEEYAFKHCQMDLTVSDNIIFGKKSFIDCPNVKFEKLNNTFFDNCKIF